MDVNETIVTLLESIGVDHMFGGSGQVNGSMLIALKKKESIKTVIVRNEQAASFMACGYSMYNSDKLGVCFATGGPGAFNLFSGLAVAYSDSLPILAITGYASKANRGKGALNESSGLSRTPDSQVMFSATTKKSFIIENAADTCDIVEEAINLAFEGRPGPVHIHVPKNITVEEVLNFRSIELKVAPVTPEKSSVTEAIEFLGKSLQEKKKIALLVGYGTIRSHAESEVLAFVEKYQIPFFSTMDGKGSLPENHKLSLGVYGTSGDPSANSYFAECDVVIALGNSFAQNATFSFKPDLYDDKKLIHINIDSHEIGKVYRADYSMVTDIKTAISLLDEGLSSKNIAVETSTVISKKHYDLPVEHSGSKIHPAELVKELSRHLPKNAIVMGDAGSHMLWLNCYLNLDKNQRYQNPGSFGPMASHVNGALGVKCADMKTPVICGCGDGAYLMAGFELLTAVENKIPVVWVIFDNGEFNIIKKLLLNNFGEEAFMTFKNPNFVTYAEACGAKGFRVEKIEDFGAIFDKAVALNEPVIIDVVVENEVYPPFSLSKV